MYLVVKMHNSNDYDDQAPDFAVVELDSGYIDRIDSRDSVANSIEDDVAHVAFTDAKPDYTLIPTDFSEVFEKVQDDAVILFQEEQDNGYKNTVIPLGKDEQYEFTSEEKFDPLQFPRVFLALTHANFIQGAFYYLCDDNNGESYSDIIYVDKLVNKFWELSALGVS